MFGAPVVNDPALATVAVFAQNQDLQAQLHPVGIPELHPVLSLARRPRLVIHRADLAGGKKVRRPFVRRRGQNLDEVQLGDHPEALRAEGDRARVDRLEGILLWRIRRAIPGPASPATAGSAGPGASPTSLQRESAIATRFPGLFRLGRSGGRRRHRPGPAVHLLVDRRPARGIGILHKHPLHILVVEEPGAIDKLVEQARGEGIGGWGGWRKLACGRRGRWRASRLGRGFTARILFWQRGNMGNRGNFHRDKFARRPRAGRGIIRNPGLGFAQRTRRTPSSEFVGDQPFTSKVKILTQFKCLPFLFLACLAPFARAIWFAAPQR